MMSEKDSAAAEIKNRFLALFAARLAARNLDVRDHLWFHPNEEDLDDKDASVFQQMDLHQHEEFLQQALDGVQQRPLPDLDNEVLPYLQERFILVRVGGLGSHLIKARPFEELQALDPKHDWVFELEYGNTLTSSEECLQVGMAAGERLLERSGGRKILFVSHSRGTNLALDLTTEEACRAIGDRVRGILSFAGAIGGSPVANGPLAERVKSLPLAGVKIQQVRSAVGQRLSSIAPNEPLLRELPTVIDMAKGLNDLTPETRQRRLARVEWPADKLFAAVGAVVVPGQPRPLEQLAGHELTRRFIDFAGYDLSKFSHLNDTQVLLKDAKWPAAARGAYFGTIKSDHFGLVYEKLLPILRPDQTPRLSLYEAVLMQAYELLSHGQDARATF